MSELIRKPLTAAAAVAAVICMATSAQATPFVSLVQTSDNGSQAIYDVVWTITQNCISTAACDALTASDLSIKASGADIIITDNIGFATTYTGSGPFGTYWTNPGPDGNAQSVNSVLATVGGTITSTTATSTGRVWASGGFFSSDISGFLDVPAELAGRFGGFEGDGAGSGFGGTISAGTAKLGTFIVNYTAAVPAPGTFVLMGLGMAGLAFARRRTA